MTAPSAVSELAAVLEKSGSGGAAARVLPVPDELAGLFPWGGLRRGSTVAMRGSTSLLLSLLATATGDSSWAAIVGMPNLGVLAAAELGVPVDRLALVPNPGAEFAAVVAALLDGIDLVAVDLRVLRGRLNEPLARRLSARARNRGAVLLPVGAWPGADVQLTCARGQWSGLEPGCGYLRTQELTISARGRGAAARPMRASIQLPGNSLEHNGFTPAVELGQVG